GVGEPRIAEQVVVAEVAPVGDQETRGAVTPPRRRPARDVRERVLHARKEAVPARRSRAYPELETALGELAYAVVVEVRLVPPVAEHQVAIKLADPLGMREHEVGPDQRAPSERARHLARAVHVLGEQPSWPERVGEILRLPAAEIPRLVAVGVEEARTEVRQVLLVEVSQQLVAARIPAPTRPP